MCTHMAEADDGLSAVLAEEEPASDLFEEEFEEDDEEEDENSRHRRHRDREAVASENGGTPAQSPATPAAAPTAAPVEGSGSSATSTSAAGVGAASAAGAAGKTLCLRSLPPDFSPRELRCLVGLLPGFEDCHLVGRDGIGFVRFASADEAKAACSLLSAFVVDPAAEPPRPLMAEVARRELESRVPRPRQPRNGRPPVPAAPLLPHAGLAGV